MVLNALERYDLVFAATYVPLGVQIFVKLSLQHGRNMTSLPHSSCGYSLGFSVSSKDSKLMNIQIL